MSSHSIVKEKKQLLVSTISSASASLKIGNKRIASTNSVQNEEGYIDWYWATYNTSTGQVVSETYLYTTCNGTTGRNVTQPSPCVQAKVLLTKPDFMSKWNYLKGNLWNSFESGYFFRANESTSSFIYEYISGIQYPLGATITAFPATPIDGFIHNHYTVPPIASALATLPTFSGSDIGYVYKVYDSGMMVNSNSFTAGVVSSAGSYIIKIDNATTFASYGESNLKNNQWQNFEGEYSAQAQFLISVMGMLRDAA